MKPRAFDYARPGTVREAATILAQAEGDGRVISGGQTLGPMLNMRLATPGILVDVSGIPEMKRVERTADGVRLGAAVTHATFEDWDDPSPLGRLMATAGGSIAYRAVRNRGTIGGSLCHADPAADWVSTMTLLDARMTISGARGSRQVPMADFMLGTFSTALELGEVLEAIELKALSAGTRWGYFRLCRKVGEFPDAIGAVLLDNGRNIARVVAGGVEGRPALLPGVAQAVAESGAVPELAVIEAAIEEIEPGIDPIDRQLHAAAVRRAIARALA